MSDTILENLATRKLIIFSSGALVLVIICFFLGGLLAPVPCNVEIISGMKCQALDHHEWHVPRGSDGKPVNCNTDVNNTNDIVFAFQVPLPVGKNQKAFSRWIQSFAGIIYFYIANQNSTFAITPTFEIRLGYNDHEDPTNNWTLIASSVQQRDVYCHPYNEQALNKMFWECDFMPLFQLEDMPHNYYLLNLYPLTYNSSGWQIGKWPEEILDATLMTVTQNEIYVKFFLSLKTVCCVSLVAGLIWFWRRVVQLTRPSLMYERLILSLGIILSLLNFPVQFLILWIGVPYMTFINCAIQDSFFLCLFGFWLIFFAEHLGRSERNKLSLYWQQILAVIIGCLPVFGCELYNKVLPYVSVFYTETYVMKNVNIGFFILSGILSFVYLLVLGFLIVSVYRKVDFKISCLPNMLGALTLGYGRTMQRVKFLLIASILCACVTFSSLLAEQVIQNWWKFGWNVAYLQLGALTIGSYGLRNIYIITILILYAPSQRFRQQPFLCHENSSSVLSDHYEAESVK